MHVFTACHHIISCSWENRCHAPAEGIPQNYTSHVLCGYVGQSPIHFPGQVRKGTPPMRGPLVTHQSTHASTKNAVTGTIISVADQPVSSVEISTRQKGLPSVTVKIYNADAQKARDEALALYFSTLVKLEEGITEIGYLTPATREKYSEPVEEEDEGDS